VPLAAVSLAVVVGVVVAQRSGGLEPLMFEASLLAFVVARRSPSPAGAIGLGLVAEACPVAVSVVQDPSEISVGIWILGIAFPWVIGLAVARQAQLAAQLEATRRELADQALLEERRRSACSSLPASSATSPTRGSPCGAQTTTTSPLRLACR
jgi:hypothetical protein